MSRAAAREDQPACDVSTAITSGNGQLTRASCGHWQSGHRRQPEAALSLTALNDAFRAKFGRDICLTDSYRTYGSQQRVAWTKPGLAAVPGRSMHGWGLAIDLCGGSYGSSDVWNWLKANGPVYGWDNPAWARPGGRVPTSRGTGSTRAASRTSPAPREPRPAGPTPAGPAAALSAAEQDHAERPWSSRDDQGLSAVGGVRRRRRPTPPVLLRGPLACLGSRGVSLGAGGDRGLDDGRAAGADRLEGRAVVRGLHQVFMSSSIGIRGLAGAHWSS